MISKNVTIGLIQSSAAISKEENIDKAITNIEKAAVKGAQIICLGEMFGSLYFPHSISINNFSLAETIPGFTTNKMAAVAKRLGVYLIVPIFEVEDRCYYNTAAVINPDGSIVGKYRKNHIPQNAGFQEKYYFKPGNLGYPVFETPFCKFGISICWDHWFVEPQRAYGIQGCHIVFSPTAVGYCDFSDVHIDKDYLEIWKTMFRGQCIQNGIYIAVANRVGKEQSVGFFGNSAVYAPRGNTVASLDEDEGVLVTEIDVNQCETWMRHQQFWRDLR
jgi:N-carbamoylputrescine amidase